MTVDEEPPVLLTATDVPRLLEELPVGARAGKPVTCRGTVRSRRRTAAHTFVMLSLEDGAGGSEGRSTDEVDGRAIVQLVLPGAHSAEPALWCEPYLSPGAELSCCGAPGCGTSRLCPWPTGHRSDHCSSGLAPPGCTSQTALRRWSRV